MIVQILIQVFFFLISINGAFAGESKQVGTAVALDKPVHFLTTDGAGIVVQPGTYDVEVSQEHGDGNALVLKSQGRDAMTVAAETTRHDEQLSEIMLLAENRTDDELHLMLLLPNGEALDAIGSYSGVRSRAARRRPYRANQIVSARARAKAAAVRKARTASSARKRTIRRTRRTAVRPVAPITSARYPSPSRPPRAAKPVYTNVNLTLQGVGNVELYSYTRSGTTRTLNIAGQTFLYEDIDGMGILDGDIILGPVSMLQQFALGVRPRAVVANPVFAPVPFFGARWPGGVVPFRFNNNVSASMRQTINAAIAHWEANTRIDLRPATAQDQNLIEFRDGDGCSSSIGMQGGVQFINLNDPGCDVMGIVAHEIGHALGFFHEQSRCDRNQHIQIKFENVVPEKQHNFWQACVIGLDIGAYNYGSIMHYSNTAFTKNNQATIVPLSSLPPGVTMGQRNGLSPGDIDAFNTLYPAPAAPITSPEEVVTQITYEVETLLANASGNAVANGTYFLRCERGGKLLDVSASCDGENQCKTQLWSLGQSAKNNKFSIYKSEGVGYRIKNQGKFLEVDFWRANQNGVNPWMMGYAPVPQQDWLFYEVGENRYVIRNVLSGKVLDAKNSCTNQNGCKVQQWNAVSNDMSQVWILDPAN